MPKKPSSSNINQTATGDDNIQVGGSNNVITRITNYFAADTEAQRAKNNRRVMLELVKNTWIKGVLEKSLYNEVLIELDMEERPGAVGHPWDMQVQMPNRSNRALPPGASIIQVFGEMNGAMLILGVPGSGKTTMLLELARDCIARAERDDNQSIPVIFNLSSWDGKQTIDDWLVNELNTKYNVPKKTAGNWVENDDLQLLLDGLDEVKLENRLVCVKAINDFHQKHGFTVPIAICSRVADYEALTTKLSLAGAVLLEPLKPQQIDAYFEQVGSELEGAYQTLKKDEILQEMVKQPLMLSIMTLTYQGKPAEASASEDMDTIKTRRKHLFDDYIQQMFERVARTKRELYTSEQTKRWLAWLARKMIERSAVPYLLESIQPAWLGWTKQWSYRLITRLIVGLIFGLIILPLEWLTIGLSERLSVENLMVGLSAFLILGLIVGLTDGLVFALFWGPISWRVSSRSMVVLPEPGAPRMSNERPIPIC